MRGYPIWGDSTRPWRAIPSSELNAALGAIKAKCKPLFNDRRLNPNSTLIETAIEGRLYQARRYWLKTLRASKRQEGSSTDLASQNEDSEANIDAMQAPPEHAEIEASRSNVMDIKSLLQLFRSNEIHIDPTDPLLSH